MAVEPISPSQAHIGVALAMQVLLLSNQDALSPTRSRLSEVRNHVFSEAIDPLGADAWTGPYNSPGIDALLCTICQLTAAWSIQQQPTILVHALILVETMITQYPGVLTAATARSLMLTAVWLSVKVLVDDELCNVTMVLRRTGFDAINIHRCRALEAAFLRALDFRVTATTREWYSRYVVELRALADANVNELRAAMPEMIGAIERMDRPTRASRSHSRSRSR